MWINGIKPEQCNYSVCELDKYSWYLAGGKPFTIYTDNRALSRLENINIEKVKNSHVMHILEDLLGYNFVVKHVSARRTVWQTSFLEIIARELKPHSIQD